MAQGLIGSGERVCLADLRVVSGALPNVTGECFPVYLDQTEAWPEAFVPFEIVEERPVEIAANVGTVLDGAMDGGKSAREKVFPEGVASVGETVFGNINGFSVGLQFNERLIDGFRIQFPAEVGSLFVRIFIETVVDDISVVVIESDEVLVVSDPIEKPSVPDVVREYFECPIDERVFSDLERNLVLGDADFRIRSILFDACVRFLVRFDECEIGAKVFRGTFFLRWPCRLEISVSRHHIGFVESDPKCHVASESIRNLFGVAREVFGEARREHTAFSGEPERKRPVPESHEGFDVSRSEGADDVLVVPYLFLIESSFFRLDARPLDRESMRRMMEFFRNIKVFFVAVVVIAGNFGAIVLRVGGFFSEFLRPAGEMTEFGRRFRGETFGIRFFPEGPVIGCVALYLMRRRCRAPKETGWEFPNHIVDKTNEEVYINKTLTGVVPV